MPADISVAGLAQVTRDLMGSSIYGSPPKMDALAVLRLTQLLIVNCAEFGAPGQGYEGLKLLGRTPSDVISGLAVTCYQSLGNRKSVLAMDTLGLPGWFAVNEEADARDWLEILEEHQAVLRGLRDDHSDEIQLLVMYRRFLEGRGEGAAEALLEFMERYGPFLVRARAQKRRVRHFQTNSLRRVLVGIEYKPAEILNDQGFQAVAAAIRKATVKAQAQKAMGIRDHRQVRYDLLSDLRRKRALPGNGPLIEAVADFISKYNRENARRHEMHNQAPCDVTTEQFASFAGIVETFGASTVGALLCAYASCREPREPDAEEAAAAS